MSQQKTLTGKWAMVTGASRGVGKLISQNLADLGANLILHSRKVEHTELLAKELRSKGIQVLTVAAELGNPNEVESLLNWLKNEAPQIDILYNNAAIMTPWQSNAWSIPADDFRISFETSVITPIRICHAVVPGMLERKFGRVVNVTSGIQNEPQLTAYAISKAALDKFVRDFTPALVDTGVQMQLLDPGWLRTDLGGPNAPNDPSSVIPGALVPALTPTGFTSGTLFRAQDFAGLSLVEALLKSESFK